MVLSIDRLPTARQRLVATRLKETKQAYAELTRAMDRLARAGPGLLQGWTASPACGKASTPGLARLKPHM